MKQDKSSYGDHKYTHNGITVEWIHNTDIDDIFRIYKGKNVDNAEYQSYPEGMRMTAKDVYYNTN